jgi:hypothetical protein
MIKIKNNKKKLILLSIMLNSINLASSQVNIESQSSTEIPLTQYYSQLKENFADAITFKLRALNYFHEKFGWFKDTFEQELKKFSLSQQTTLEEIAQKIQNPIKPESGATPNQSALVESANKSTQDIVSGKESLSQASIPFTGTESTSIDTQSRQIIENVIEQGSSNEIEQVAAQLQITPEQLKIQTQEKINANLQKAFSSPSNNGDTIVDTIKNAKNENLDLINLLEPYKDQLALLNKDSIESLINILNDPEQTEFKQMLQSSKKTQINLEKISLNKA